jgi:hypothetical protein
MGGRGWVDMDNKVNKAEQYIRHFFYFSNHLFSVLARFQIAEVSTPSTANSAQLSLNPKRKIIFRLEKSLKD